MFSKILIGNQLRVISASDKTLISRSGRIIDETRGTLTIRDSTKKEVRIPKSHSTFEIEFDSKKKLVVSGSEIAGSIVERIYEY